MATQLRTDPPAARAIALPADGARVQSARSQAVKGILIGLGAFLVGLVITVVTYSDASSSSTGGTYVVAWGPMVFGAIAVVRGLITLARTSKLK